MPDDYQDYDVYTNDTGNEPLPSLGSGDYGSADPDARRKQLRQLYQGPASQRYQDLLSQGAPALPQPKLWQRIAAGAMGAAAGAHDASGLRIGGRPVPSLMPEAMNAAANVQGVTDYNRQTQDYMRKIGIAQKGAAEERQSQMDAERAYSDDLRDQETKARLGLIKSQQDYFRDIRGQQEKDREERTRAREAQNIAQVEEKGGQFVPPTTTTDTSTAAVPGMGPVSITAPTPPANAPGVKGAGYVPAPSMPGQAPNTTLYMPTTEQTQAIKQGMQEVPPDLKDMFGGQEVAPAADIRAARNQKAMSERAAATQQEITSRQDSLERSREAARAQHDRDNIAFKATVDNMTQDNQSRRQANAQLDNADRQYQVELDKLEKQYAQIAAKPGQGFLGFGKGKPANLTPQQQAEFMQKRDELEKAWKSSVQNILAPFGISGEPTRGQRVPAAKLPPTVGSVVPRPKVAAPPGSTNETDPGGVTGRTPGSVRSAGPPNAPGSAKLPTITTKAQRDALPSDTQYIGPDGKTYQKP